MKAMRTARLRLRRHKPKLQVIDDPVHDGYLQRLLNCPFSDTRRLKTEQVHPSAPYQIFSA
jgi:hypothetical protein